MTYVCLKTKLYQKFKTRPKQFAPRPRANHKLKRSFSIIIHILPKFFLNVTAMYENMFNKRKQFNEKISLKDPSIELLPLDQESNLQIHLPNNFHQRQKNYARGQKEKYYFLPLIMNNVFFNVF